MKFYSFSGIDRIGSIEHTINLALNDLMDIILGSASSEFHTLDLEDLMLKMLSGVQKYAQKKFLGYIISICNRMVTREIRK